MLKILGTLFLVLGISLSAPAQCGRWGCPAPPPPAAIKSKEKIKIKQPTPAWRYEHPTAHRAAVVRIVCEESTRGRSIGSGVIVRWGGRVVALTARHVVRDAKRIWIILHTKKRVAARLICVDATWDCAVLLPLEAIERQFVAEMALGSEAMPQVGERLESCGYGTPEDKLAANNGLFRGFRRSTQTPRGPDDWLVLSGHARPGDSGGPIFNARGQVVGILWGTDGEEVIGVQAGRLHLLLDEAAAQLYHERSFVRLQHVESRRPTPPRVAPLVPLQPNGEALLPWREKTEERLIVFDRQLNDITKRLEELTMVLEKEHASRVALEQKIGSLPGQENGSKEVANAREAEPRPLLAGLCILAGVFGGFVIYFCGSKT